MNTTGKPRAIVIGGSLGGLLSAATMRAAGWEVELFESSPNQLDSRGGGVVLQRDVLVALAFAGVELPNPPGVASGERIYLDRDDHYVERIYMPQMQTAWGLLYHAMKRALPAHLLHAGETFTGFRMESDEVRAEFASGRIVYADLLIGADGIRSTLRGQLLPDVKPAYAGYVAWRGLVPEPGLPQFAADTLRERFTFEDGDGHSALSYMIPGDNDETRPGERRWNWVWYRHYSAAVLERLLIDRDGVQRAFSLPPGKTKDADIAALRDDAQTMLGPTFRALVDATGEPFMQPIVDLRVPRMVFGRALLLGDAASVPRPHTAGSTAKAAANAHALALALMPLARAAATQDIDQERFGQQLDAALAGWERQQLQLGTSMTDLGVSLGNRLMKLGG